MNNYKERLDNTIKVVKEVLEKNKDKEEKVYKKIVELENKRRGLKK